MNKVLKSDGMRKCIGCYACQRVCAMINHRSYSDTESAIRVHTLGGITGRFFATHCFACDDDRACLDACPAGALTAREGGGVILHEKKCIKCGKCADACIVQAIHFVSGDSYPIICKHCGICVRYCPHGCLRMGVKSDD